MGLTPLDVTIFITFFAVVVGVSMYKSRREETSEDFFLAGRGLLWPLIGLSLIAANISTEHFVGMSGEVAKRIGLAVASYEWIAAITLVFVALFLLPKFLRSGIFTIPEYLEYRYNATARGIMALYTVVILVGVCISAVVYTGALVLNVILGMNMTLAVWIVGVLAALYATWGGLKAVAWADIFQGSALIIGGAITMVLGFRAVGGVSSFFEANADRLHMVLPKDDADIPWTALVVGLWIPNFYYWGLNQFIVQRSLAAKTLRHGQLGVIFAAALKLLIPFVIVIPGIMSLQLYGDELGAIKGDAAYPLLVKNLIPPGLKGFILAAIAGAIVSSLASMLNSGSTIFTIDLYKRHWKKDASPRSLVTVGRIATIVFLLIVCLIAPQLDNPGFGGIFTYIQEFQGYISPGILAVFVFGMIFKKAPAAAGVTGLILSVPVYGLLQWRFGDMAFLNRMAITFVIDLIAMGLITAVAPLPAPKVMPVREEFDMRPAKSVVWLGGVVIAITLVLYAIFW